MPGKEELEITISPEGQIKVHIKGIKGKKCAELMNRLGHELGFISEQRYTSEYYEQEESTQIHGKT
jgi:hypothetical protein